VVAASAGSPPATGVGVGVSFFFSGVAVADAEALWKLGEMLLR